MKKLVWAVTVATILLLIACGGNQPKPVDDKELSNEANSLRPAAQPATGGTYGSQSSGRSERPAAPAKTATPVEKPAELVDLEKSYETNPKNEEVKKKLIKATYDFGYKIEHESPLPPFQKYPTALRLFRRVLELDPNHTEAAAEKQQIEDIYKSMGRPIPE